MDSLISIVIPARNAERTIATTLKALRSQRPVPLEVIVVDDASSDGTARVAREHGARVIVARSRCYAGGARNLGWDEANGEVVVFLDADDVPTEGWARGLWRALEEYPDALVGCAHTFVGRTPWEWVLHLQLESPRLPRGAPRDVGFLASYCLALPVTAPLRWDESYGGEDTVFCLDARAAGLRLVFDPRFSTCHAPGRDTFTAVRARQRRLAYELARAAPVALEGRHKQVLGTRPGALLRACAAAGDLPAVAKRSRATAAVPPAPSAPRACGVAARRQRAAIRADAAATTSAYIWLMSSGSPSSARPPLASNTTPVTRLNAEPLRRQSPERMSAAAKPPLSS